MCEAADVDVFTDGIPPDRGILSGRLTEELVVLDTKSGTLPAQVPWQAGMRGRCRGSDSMPQAMRPDQLLRAWLFCAYAEHGETWVPREG